MGLWKEHRGRAGEDGGAHRRRTEANPRLIKKKKIQLTQHSRRAHRPCLAHTGLTRVPEDNLGEIHVSLHAFKPISCPVMKS